MTIASAVQVRKDFVTEKRFLRKGESFVRAVDDVSLEIRDQEIHSLVGETGSGKTTLGKLFVGLSSPTEGTIRLFDVNMHSPDKEHLKQIRSKVQMIFQDPYSSIDPRFTVKQTIEEPMRLNKMTYDEKDLIDLLERVELVPGKRFLDRYPHQLSGGQRQRVSVARSLSVRPEFIVADEPVSMLDVSIRANFLRLFKDLNKTQKVTLLIITHDISTASYVSDRISVMYLGSLVETGNAKRIMNSPLHPYTQALIQAVPILGKKVEKINIKDEEPKSATVSEGCKFYHRCPFAKSVCLDSKPLMEEVESGHWVACHLY